MAEALTTMNKEPSEVNGIYQKNTGINFPLDISNTYEGYLSKFEIGDNSMDHNLTHKYYGYKRKELPNYSCEIFPLSDDPIFSNTPHFLNQISKSPLDIETADPWDLSLINLNYVDCPWLVDSLLVSENVKTPYSHVESLVLCDEVRYKVEPYTNQVSVSNAQLDSPDWSTSTRTQDNLFTSTPLKSQAAIVGDESSKVADNTAAVVTTIEIPNKNDNNVDLSVIKDHVIKALEQVIKSKNTMTNIDMKIEIVASPNENLSPPTQKACVKVRIDDSTETASSSKENHSLETSHHSVDKVQMFCTKQSPILTEDCSSSISSSTDVDVSTSGTLAGKKSMAQNRRRKKRNRFLLPTRRSIRSLRSSNTVSAENSKENETSLLRLQKPEDSNLNLNENCVNASLNIQSPVLIKNGVTPSVNQANNEKCDSSNIFSIDSTVKHEKFVNGHKISQNTSGSSCFEDDTALKTKEITILSDMQVISSVGHVNGPINDKLSSKHAGQLTKPAKSRSQVLSNGIIKLNGQSTKTGLMHKEDITQQSSKFNDKSKNGRISLEFERMLPSEDFITTNISPIVDNNNIATKKRVLRSSFKASSEIVELNSKDKRRETVSTRVSVTPDDLKLQQQSDFETSAVPTIEASKISSSNESPSKYSVDMSNSTTDFKSPVSCHSETIPSLNNILKATKDTSIDMENEVLNGLPELSREDEDNTEFEDKNHKSLMKQNGIINRVKIVLNPLALEKEANSDHEKEDCPVLSAELPLIEAEKVETTKPDNICKPIDSLADIPDITSTVEENKLEIKKPDIYKDFKMEDKVYQIGDLVWAQVARYPYWPAIICSDPITNRHTEQVENRRKSITQKLLYHLKFFGDHGRRAWVNKQNLLPYYDKDDLVLTENLKKEGSQNRYFLVSKIKPALRKGQKKWRLALEEIESQKHNSYEKILAYLDNNSRLHWEMRKERRKRSLDASSESESEDTTTDGKLQNTHFSMKQDSAIELDEINLSVGTKAPDIQLKTGLSDDNSTPSQTTVNDKKYLDTSQDSQRYVRRSGRSVKSVDKLDMLTLRKKNCSSMVLNPVALSTQTQGKIENDKIRESLEQNEVKENQDVDKEHCDRTSEVGSKSSSDTTVSDSNMYSFEYQLELHKRNNLYQGLKNVKVCDYCLKQGGDVQKCKGKCNGCYHSECAARVMQSRSKLQSKRDSKSPSKSHSRRFDSCAPRRSEEGRRTRSQTNCEIITIKSKHVIDAPAKESFPQELSIAEQIDFGMKELMSKFINGESMYQDSTDSGSDDGSMTLPNNLSMESPSSSSTATGDIPGSNDDFKSLGNSEICLSSESSNSYIKHVTADCVELLDPINVVCAYCRSRRDPPCFACGLEVSKKGESDRQKCSTYRCGRYFHVGCLKLWPQTQWPISGKWSKDSFTCPSHRCHTCFSEELGSSVSCRLPGDKLARCLLCPAAFHATTFCTPAGCEILGGSQILCPRHRTRPIQPINTIWCFICSQGGNLVCCDSCPTSVHPECQPVNLTDDDKYICEDCESGRFPLYDEIVWVKLGHFRWWPAIILFPNEVPVNVSALKHQKGDFVVRFFGTNDYHWVNKSRSFLFQEGDTGDMNPKDASRLKGKVYELFGKAVEDAAKAYQLKKEFKLRREAECIDSLKPPPYIKINKSKPVGRVKFLELNLSSATACECNPNVPFPCGPDSNCINRLLMTECDPAVCPAGNRCRNQAFQKREYPIMVPYKTQGRGWGLKSLAPIKKGQFVIEYVGELIDSEEYQRRIKKMHEKKEENYYFMTVDGDRMIDAGPKGNISRFMNHSCDPNCVTQKWTVKGETRVGLFAKCNIESGSELTFNYNLEVVGQEKKICKCGATNCSGFIGVKATKTDKLPENAAENAEQPRKVRKYVKKSLAPEPIAPPCFVCGKTKSDITCNNKFCNKGYHLKCLQLMEMPDASKYMCPRHNCKICTHRTIRCCVKCTNSFCPSHSDGNVRYDDFLGFVCRLHDPVRTPAVKRRRPKDDSPLDECVTSTSRDEEASKTDNQASTSMRSESPDYLDDVSLSERLLRWSGKVPRKRRRISVTRFPATEKST